MNQEEIRRLLIRTANVAVGPSTVRNQGASGVVDAARRALKAVDLNQFKGVALSKFRLLLNAETETIRKKLPTGAKNWGAARKCLNIYLRDVLYSRYLCEAYKFDRLESLLEVPLDKDIGKRLKAEPEGTQLARWDSIKRLPPEVSDQYQGVARQVAERLKTHPIHLDLLYWSRSQK